MKTIHQRATFLIAAVIFTIGCPRNDAQITPEVDDQNTATIEGRLQMPAEIIEGTSIVVHEVRPDGQLLDRTVGVSQTDATGAYQVEFELSGDSLRDLIVEAHRNNERVGRVIVVESVGSGDAATAAPINQETTIEADLFVRAITDGQWDARNSASFLRTLVSPSMAAAVATSSDYEADVELLARAVTANMKAFADIATHEQFDTDQDTLNNAMENLQDMQVEFDQTLHDTTNMDETQNAYQDYYSSWMDALVDTDMGLEQSAIATQAGVEAQRIYLPELSDNLRGATFAHVESLRAIAVTRLVNERFDEMEFDLNNERQQAIEQAGATLRNRIASLAPTDTNIDQNIQSGWSEYRQVVNTHLQDALDDNQRPIFNQLNAQIQGQRNTYFENLNQLTPATDSTLMANTSVQAVPNFYNNTFSQTNRTTLQNVDMSDNQTKALLDILFNLSLAADR